jgi:tetratricopeptide (TPR) repeat protein
MWLDIINLVYFQGCQMLNIRLSVLALTFVSLSVPLLSGCAGSTIDPTAVWTPEKIYSEARDESSAGAWDRAAMLFDKLEGRAAGTPLAQQAQIEKAYAQYRSGEKVQAIGTLDRFLKLHPASPAIDYALYLKGLVNFNDNLGLFSFITKQDLSERDQKAAKDSFESFKELTQRYSVPVEPEKFIGKKIESPEELLSATGLVLTGSMWVSSSVLQNQSFSVGDVLGIDIVALTGSLTEIIVQVDFIK